MSARVTVKCNGVVYEGIYSVSDGVITVACEHATRQRPVLRAKIPWLARHVLREIIAHARKWGKLNRD